MLFHCHIRIVPFVILCANNCQVYSYGLRNNFNFLRIASLVYVICIFTLMMRSMLDPVLI